MYDYSYWSVDPPSVNHTSQEQVYIYMYIGDMPHSSI